MNQVIEHNGHYHCDLDITKEQWLDLLKDDEIVGYAKETLLKIYYSPEHKNTCKGITDDGSPQSANSIIMNFGKRVGKKLNMTIIGTDGKQKYWPFPMKEGVDLPNGLFEWTLRDELVEAIKELWDNNKFTWIPFYQELAKKLLEYKNKRNELIEFIFSEEGLEEFSDYLHLQDKNQKINDIDPFSFFGMFNRGKQKFENRKKILEKIKQKLNIEAEVPSDFSGIPVLNYMRMFYYHWKDISTLKDSCDKLWNAFGELMNPNTPNPLPFFEYCGFPKRLAESTIPLYWIKPNDFISLDSTSIEYFEHYHIDISIKDTNDYFSLIKNINNKIQNGEIKEISFPDISYNAWTKKDSSNIQFWSGGIKWNNGKLNKLIDFNKEGCWQIGWNQDDESKGAKQAWKNIKKVKVGDFLSFHGYGGRNDLIIYQISKVTNKDEKQGKLFFEKLNKDTDTLFHGKAPKLAKGTWQGTLFPIIGQDAINKIFENYIIKENTLKMLTDNGIDQYSKIISNKKNLILQGAPGTGKTYNTAALALSICGVTDVDLNDHKAVMERYEKLQKAEQIGFVTFHQSMDYEDFVEGIKPKTEDGAITYDIEDGIFKKISDRALANYEDSLKTIDDLQKQKNIQEKIKDFLVTAQENGTEISTQLGYKFIITEISDKNVNLEIITEKTINGAQIKNSTRSISLTELTEILEKEIPINKVRDITNYFNRKISSRRDYYTFYIANEINKIKTKTVEVQKIELQNYVLIIDEINRGNVSKIFGELITLLEADKRLGGEHPIKVTLPYSKDEFGVPSNLYIIGTMNTTDRSVGNIDYAVRRRFAFVTLKSKREIVEDKWGTDDCKAVRLFDAVKSFIEKNKYDMDIEDLMVGHSYFMANDDSELELKWQYEILPLLNEYIKDGILKGDPIKSDMAISEYIKEWNKSADNNE